MDNSIRRMEYLSDCRENWRGLQTRSRNIEGECAVRVLIARTMRCHAACWRRLLPSGGTRSCDHRRLAGARSIEQPGCAILGHPGLDEPGLDGAQVCLKARALAGERLLYMILLTAKGRKEDIVEALPPARMITWSNRLTVPSCRRA